MNNKMTPFDIVNDVLKGKRGVYKDSVSKNGDEKAYVPFLINRALSMHLDLIYIVNTMNEAWWLDKTIQHDFYFFIINKKYRKRPAWAKLWKKNSDENFQAVQEYYDSGYSETKEILRVLNDEQLETIRERVCKGGRDDDKD